jgi:type IV pilus assembly protein PilQ
MIGSMRVIGVVLALLVGGSAFASRAPSPAGPGGPSVKSGKQVPLSARQASKPAPESAPPEPTAFTGRRVDLDFRNANIHHILGILADVGQVAIVPADDVRGEVSIKMRDVRWDQALHIVARMKKLSYEREGNSIRVWKTTR